MLLIIIFNFVPSINANSSFFHSQNKTKIKLADYETLKQEWLATQPKMKRYDIPVLSKESIPEILKYFNIKTSTPYGLDGKPTYNSYTENYMYWYFKNPPAGLICAFFKVRQNPFKEQYPTSGYKYTLDDLLKYEIAIEETFVFWDANKQPPQTNVNITFVKQDIYASDNKEKAINEYLIKNKIIQEPKLIKLGCYNATPTTGLVVPLPSINYTTHEKDNEIKNWLFQAQKYINHKTSSKEIQFPRLWSDKPFTYKIVPKIDFYETGFTENGNGYRAYNEMIERNTIQGESIQKAPGKYYCKPTINMNKIPYVTDGVELVFSEPVSVLEPPQQQQIEAIYFDDGIRFFPESSQTYTIEDLLKLSNGAKNIYLFSFNTKKRIKSIELPDAIDPYQAIRDWKRENNLYTFPPLVQEDDDEERSENRDAYIEINSAAYKKIEIIFPIKIVKHTFETTDCCYYLVCKNDTLQIKLAEQYRDAYGNWMDQCYIKPGISYSAQEIRNKFGRSSRDIYNQVGEKCRYRYVTNTFIDDWYVNGIECSGWNITFSNFYDTTPPPKKPQEMCCSFFHNI
ncbi:hypothetical protein [Candidatus Phytoplasma australiense]|uniref:Uncharacterized protein n=1 Tax=Strawberry lethal yellows phytoplasma (CPA) str. NZSb11 TaxID=980422 RepID=R4RMI3_PHYAS|nr:hypothetical protein [Candidatus Phytoplasma australiense]AGL90520.1 Hypothetical Protein SLY_0604 [Strawberry lethal yellows phytoplasma (CPA) str. NZSb11]